MQTAILFSERQRFRQWWLWTILIGVNGLILFGIYRQLIQGEPFGDKPMSNAGLLFTEALVLAVTILSACITLETKITAEGIYVRFLPFARRFYSWQTISKAYIRKYNALTEYGGWGLRWSMAGRGKAYNVSGRYGLQLEFTDNKKLLIGTQDQEALQEALAKAGQLKY